MQIPFVGPTYQSRSLNINASRSVNLYPEINPEDSKTVMALIGTPGLSLAVNTGVHPVRGMHPFNGLMYVVAGPNLVSINAAGTMSSVLGVLSTRTGRVWMANNGLTSLGIGGNDLFIVDGTAGYNYDVSTGTFTTVSGGGFPTYPETVDYIDGYFVVTSRDRMSFFVSNLYDGTTWNALATASVIATPDKLRLAVNNHQQLWLVKEYSTEVWYNTGTPTSQGSPFSRIHSAVIDYGTIAPASVAKLDNTLYWLAQQKINDTGQLIGVVRLNGYTPEIKSTYAINHRMSQFSTVSDAFAYGYSDSGHIFYVLTFPSANATLVYDVSTNMWHEWSSYVDSPYQIGRHLGNSYCNYNNKHYVGDWRNGNIYHLSSDYYTDNGNQIVAERTAQPLHDKNSYRNLSIHRLQVDIESGMATAGIDPQAMLSWSDDGGHTWSSEYPASMGALGEYRKRLQWFKLGCSRSRIFRLRMADSNKRVILGAVVK